MHGSVQTTKKTQLSFSKTRQLLTGKYFKVTLKRNSTHSNWTPDFQTQTYCIYSFPHLSEFQLWSRGHWCHLWPLFPRIPRSIHPHPLSKPHSNYKTHPESNHVFQTLLALCTCICPSVPPLDYRHHWRQKFLCTTLASESNTASHTTCSISMCWLTRWLNILNVVSKKWASL